MISEAGSGHPGGSLSAADLIAYLYFHLLRIDPQQPDWPDRDRFILSKGHCAPALYAADRCKATQTCAKRPGWT
jgi:transketolase